MNEAEQAANRAARNRFFIITTVRFAAVGLILVGMLLALGRIPGFHATIAAPLGYVLVAVGVIDLILVVPFLIRRWRSNPPPPAADSGTPPE